MESEGPMSPEWCIRVGTTLQSPQFHSVIAVHDHCPCPSGPSSRALFKSCGVRTYCSSLGGAQALGLKPEPPPQPSRPNPHCYPSLCVPAIPLYWSLPCAAGWAPPTLPMRCTSFSLYFAFSVSACAFSRHAVPHPTPRSSEEPCALLNLRTPSHRHLKKKIIRCWGSRQAPPSKKT